MKKYNELLISGRKKKIFFSSFLQLASSGKHYKKKKKKRSSGFCFSTNNEISTFLHIFLIYSSGMLFSNELTDCVVTDAKGFEGNELLTKWAQHLAELDFSNASKCIYL